MEATLGSGAGDSKREGILRRARLFHELVGAVIGRKHGVMSMKLEGQTNYVMVDQAKPAR